MKQKISIALENMKFYAFHGHYEVEQKVGNYFLVSLWADVSKTEGCVTDKLKDVIDYQQLYSVVRQEMAQPSHLLEHVAQRIADRISAGFPEVKGLKISLSKLNPPMGGEMDRVTVTLEG